LISFVYKSNSKTRKRNVSPETGDESERTRENRQTVSEVTGTAREESRGREQLLAARQAVVTPEFDRSPMEHVVLRPSIAQPTPVSCLIIAAMQDKLAIVPNSPK